MRRDRSILVASITLVLAWFVGASPAAAQPDQQPAIFFEPTPAADAELARLPLRDALEQVLAIEQPDAPQPEPPTPDDKIAAMRLYASARLLLIESNQTTQAIVKLKQAAELDPTSGAIRTLLGRARLAGGLRRSAMLDFEAAVTLGDSSPIPATMTGLDRLTAGDFEQAAPLLAGALASDPTDEGLRHIIDAALGEALIETGSLAAGAELLERGLDTPPTIFAGSQFRHNARLLLQRKGFLRVLLGDTLWRLGRRQPAIDAYKRALTEPLMDTQRARTRLVGALIAAGQHEQAAQRIIDAYAPNPASIDRPMLRLIQEVSSDATARELLSEAFAPSEPLPDEPSTRDALLVLRSVILNDEHPTGTVRDALTIENASTDRLLPAWIDAHNSPALCAQAMVTLATSTPRHATELGQVALRVGPPPRALLDALRAIEPSPARDLSLGSYEATLGHARPLPRWPGAVSTGEITALGELAAALGDWPAYEGALNALGATDDPHTRRLRAQLLIAAQRYKDALELLSELGHSAQSMRAQLMLITGDAPGAEAAYAAAIGTDPHSERLHTGLIASIEAAGGEDAPQRFLAAVHALREHLPASRVLRRLYAQDIIRTERRHDAQHLLIDLIHEDPSDPGPVNTLLALWRSSDDAQLAIERGLGVLRRLRDQHPARTTLAISLAELEAAAGDPGRALRTLEQAEHACAGDARLMRARVALLAQLPDRQSEADSLVLGLLADRPTLSIEESIWTIERLIGRGQPGIITQRTQTLLPPRAELTSPQRDRLIQLVVRQASLASMDLANTDQAHAALALIDLSLGRGLTLSPGVHRVRITLLARTSEVDAIARSARNAITQHPSLDPGAWGTAMTAMADAGRDELAPRVLTLGSIRPDGTLDPVVLAETLRTIGRLGTLADADALVEHLESAGQLAPSVRVIHDNFGLEQHAQQAQDQPARQRAEVLYAVSVVANALGRDTLANALLERALGHDPHHPWSANDLGYHLVEQHRDLDRAESLLETAAAALPNRASVIDSLGWLRYTQGRFSEAVDLLGRAIELDGGEDSGSLLDHLGDALWRAGDTAGARDAWQRASNLTSDAADNLADAGAGPAALARVQRRLDNLGAKLAALDEGLQPPAAPLPSDHP